MILELQCETLVSRDHKYCGNVYVLKYTTTVAIHFGKIFLERQINLIS